MLGAKDGRVVKCVVAVSVEGSINSADSVQAVGTHRSVDVTLGRCGTPLASVHNLGNHFNLCHNLVCFKVQNFSDSLLISEYKDTTFFVIPKII